MNDSGLVSMIVQTFTEAIVRSATINDMVTEKEGGHEAHYSELSRKTTTLVGLGAPVWAVAGLTVAAMAGQAVGPVLSGAISGSSAVVVVQTLLVNPTSSNNTVSGDGVVTVNDEGTSLTAAVGTLVGEGKTIRLVLDNQSSKIVNGIVELHVPMGLDVEVNGYDDVSALAQLNRNSYLFKVGTANGPAADIAIEVESKDDAAPGFYIFTGRIVQVSH